MASDDENDSLCALTERREEESTAILIKMPMYP
jgi:hypothetical protein